MKTKDVIVGEIYHARVSGNIVPVRVINKFETTKRRRSGMFNYTDVSVMKFEVENLKTNRIISMSAARLHP